MMSCSIGKRGLGNQPLLYHLHGLFYFFFREYLFTMPRSMEAGEPSHYCITVKGVPNINAIRSTIRFTDPNDRNNTVAEINKEPSNDGVDDDCDGIRSGR